MATGARGAARPEAAGAASLTADARIERRVEHVDGEVDEDEAERDDQDAALHEGKVAGPENPPPYPGAPPPPPKRVPPAPGPPGGGPPAGGGFYRAGGGAPGV